LKREQIDDLQLTIDDYSSKAVYSLQFTVEFKIITVKTFKPKKLN